MLAARKRYAEKTGRQTKKGTKMTENDEALRLKAIADARAKRQLSKTVDDTLIRHGSRIAPDWARNQTAREHLLPRKGPASDRSAWRHGNKVLLRHTSNVGGRYDTMGNRLDANACRLEAIHLRSVHIAWE